MQRVELKISLAGSGSRLGEALKIYLVPLLQKLTSPNGEVVQKVVELLNFIKSQKAQSEDVIFPVWKLVELYHSSILSRDSAVIRRNKQVLSFLELELTSKTGQNALRDSKLLDCLASGLRNYFENNNEIRANTAEQFSLFLLALTQVISCGIDIDINHWDALDLEVIEKQLTHLFLINTNKSVGTQPLLNSHDSAFLVEWNAKNGLLLRASNQAPFFLTRTRVLSFAKKFPETFKYTLLAATGDPMLDISRAAHTEIVNMSHFDPVKLDFWATRGNDALCLECLECLVREHDKTIVNPEVIITAFARENLQVRHASLRLLKEATTKSGSPWSGEISSQISKVLRQYISDDGWPRAPLHSVSQTGLRQLCYELIGHFDTSEPTLSFMLQSLERDSADMGVHIQKSLSAILESGQVRVDADKLLKYMLESRNARTRFATIQFCLIGLPPSAPISRLICLIGLDQKTNRTDVQREAQRGLVANSLDEMPSNIDFVDFLTDKVNIRLLEETAIDNIVLYVYATLIHYVPSSMDWMDELKASLASPSASIGSLLGGNEPRVLPVIKFLLGFVKADIHSESVLRLATKLLNHVTSTDKEYLGSGLIDNTSLLAILQNDSHYYSEFIAEYYPFLAPNVPISFTGNRVGVLALAYRAALTESCPEGLLQIVLKSKNLDALQILAISNNLGDAVDEAESLAASSQLLLACISIYASENKRLDALNKVLKSSPTSFDDIVANGEALSVCVSGWHSKILCDRYPYLLKHYGKELSGKTRASYDTSLADLTIKSIVNSIRGSRESRRLASVRLLCMVQYSFYDAGACEGYVNGFQSCFMNLLTDLDDVTQECAGRGIAILFENSSRINTLKDQLLNGMLASFTDDTAASRQSAGTLTENSEVFNVGELPSDPQNTASLRTYKDVMGLANETGDSSLVYKFMALSASSKIWAGRKGLAFSLEQIMTKSELHNKVANRSDLGLTLIPKLYRYLFDPVEITRNAMKGIWDALVPSSSRFATIKMFLPEIKSTILSGVVEREWRVREASTRALSELVSLSLVDESLDVWRAAFRAIDDIKDSVVEAGKELLKVLTNGIIRANTAGKQSDLSELIQFLLKALDADATSTFSVEALLKLSETVSFKPWASKVLSELTLRISSLEPQALNYLALNSSQALVDEARLKGLRDSKLMRGIEAMVDRGAPSNQEMWDLLPSVIKGSVGVSTEAAASRLLIQTCTISYGDEKHGTEQLLLAAFPKLWSANETVSSSFSAALGYLCRQLPTELVTRYIEQLKEKWLNSEGDDFRRRETVAAALKAISINASDTFTSVETSVLPLAFVAQYSVDNSNTFKNVWEKNTGGALSLRLYLTEILTLCIEVLDRSGVRDLKLAAATAVTVATSKLDKAMYEQPKAKDLLQQLTSRILDSLSGRSWPKKEVLFEALVCCYPATVNSSSLKRSIEEKVLAEAQRRNLDYKLGIMPVLAKFLIYADADEGLDFPPELVSGLESELAKSFVEVATDDSEDAVAAFSKIVPSFQNRDLLHETIEHAINLRSWKYRVAMCDAIRKQSFNEKSWQLITISCLHDDHYETVRLAWCRAAATFKQQSIVIADAQKRLSLEKSSLVLAELKNLLI